MKECEGGPCDLGHPGNLSSLVPSQCCKLKHIYDQNTEANCVQKYQSMISNVNIGIKGTFDGLECFFTCLLNGTKAFNNNAINVQTLKTYVAKSMNNDQTWLPIINSAIDFCNGQTINNLNNLNRSMGNRNVDNVKYCSPVPEFFASCVYFYQIRKCPQPALVNPNSKDCIALRGYYDTCPVLSLHAPNASASTAPRGR